MTDWTLVQMSELRSSSGGQPEAEFLRGISYGIKQSLAGQY
jgi:hypothetical protein